MFYPQYGSGPACSCLLIDKGWHTNLNRRRWYPSDFLFIFLHKQTLSLKAAELSSLRLDSAFLGKHIFKFLFCQSFHTQLLRFRQLAACFFSYNQVICFFAYGRSRMSA